MNNISDTENNITIPKSVSSNESKARFIGIFQQLPQGFQMAFLCGCLAIFTYIIHEGYCITTTESGIQITKYSTIM